MLQEISTCERDLLGPELERDVAGGRVQDAGGRGLRLEVVDCRHGGGDLQVNEALERILWVVVENCGSCKRLKKFW